MSEGASQITFDDAAIYFSEEQWGNLEDFQKEIYKNLIKEIYETMLYLGYRIPKPEIVSRIERGEDPYTNNPKKLKIHVSPPEDLPTPKKDSDASPVIKTEPISPTASIPLPPSEISSSQERSIGLQCQACGTFCNNQCGRNFQWNMQRMHQVGHMDGNQRMPYITHPPPYFNDAEHGIMGRREHWPHENPSPLHARDPSFQDRRNMTSPCPACGTFCNNQCAMRFQWEQNRLHHGTSGIVDGNQGTRYASPPNSYFNGNTVPQLFANGRPGIRQISPMTAQANMGQQPQQYPGYRRPSDPTSPSTIPCRQDMSIGNVSLAVGTTGNIAASASANVSNQAMNNRNQRRKQVLAPYVTVDSFPAVTTNGNPASVNEQKSKLANPVVSSSESQMDKRCIPSNNNTRPDPWRFTNQGINAVGRSVRHIAPAPANNGKPGPQGTGEHFKTSSTSPTVNNGYLVKHAKPATVSVQEAGRAGSTSIFNDGHGVKRPAPTVGSNTAQAVKRASPSINLGDNTGAKRASPSSTPVNNQNSARSTPVNNQNSPRSTPVNNQNSPRSTPVNNQNSPRSTPVNNQNSPRSTPVNNQNSARSTPVNNQNSARSTPVNNQNSARSTPVNNQNSARSTPVNYQNSACATPPTAKTGNSSTSPILVSDSQDVRSIPPEAKDGKPARRATPPITISNIRSAGIFTPPIVRAKKQENGNSSSPIIIIDDIDEQKPSSESVALKAQSTESKTSSETAQATNVKGNQNIPTSSAMSSSSLNKVQVPGVAQGGPVLVNNLQVQQQSPILVTGNRSLANTSLPVSVKGNQSIIFTFPATVGGSGIMLATPVNKVQIGKKPRILQNSRVPVNKMQGNMNANFAPMTMTSIVSKSNTIPVSMQSGQAKPITVNVNSQAANFTGNLNLKNTNINNGAINAVPVSASGNHSMGQTIPLYVDAKTGIILTAPTVASKDNSGVNNTTLVTVNGGVVAGNVSLGRNFVFSNSTPVNVNRGLAIGQSGIGNATFLTVDGTPVTLTGNTATLDGKGTFPTIFRVNGGMAIGNAGTVNAPLRNITPVNNNALQVAPTANNQSAGLIVRRVSEPTPVCKVQQQPTNIGPKTIVIDKLLKCNQCEESFTTMENLSNHQKNHKDANSTGNGDCELVSKDSTETHDLTGADGDSPTILYTTQGDDGSTVYVVTV
ncbi:uncharacterized protein O3C94_005964 isoform 2-T2 [Discoglossus pictus]